MHVTVNHKGDIWLMRIERIMLHQEALMIPAIIFILLQIQTDLDAVDPSQCIAPLGMENGGIPDNAIVASSSFDSGNVGPQHGRMRTDRNGGAWCPMKQATTEPEEWIQIDLKTVHMVTATGTQGRFGNGVGIEFAEAYILEYWRPKLDKWVRYHNANGEEVVSANMNTYLEAKRALTPPIWASKIRFYPYSYHKRTVCMRVELYGCRWLDGVVSYSMPQGDRRGPQREFYDFAYDGVWNAPNNTLVGGVGQLIDRVIGHDDYKTAYQQEEGQAWIGWRNDTRHQYRKPIEIRFEFDRIREFSAVHIYANNQFTRDIQVFSMAKVSFSIGGRYYIGEPVIYEYIEDCIFENSRNVSIKLHHRIGRYVRIQLDFSAKWLLISEVTFDSAVTHGNFTVEPEPTTKTPTTIQVASNNNDDSSDGTNPVILNRNQSSTTKPVPLMPLLTNEPVYLAVIAIGLVTLALLLSGVLYLLVNRLRTSKLLGTSPISSLDSSHGETPPHLQCLYEKGGSLEAYSVTEMMLDGSAYSYRHSNNNSTLQSQKRVLQLNASEVDDYQEPYQTVVKKFPSDSIYYEYSSICRPHSNHLQYCNNRAPIYDDDTITKSKHKKLMKKQRAKVVLRRNSAEYATPGTSPLLPASIYPYITPVTLVEFPRHRLRMLSKLSEGNFGTMYIAETDGLTTENGTDVQLVAIKFLRELATVQEKEAFYRDVQVLATLNNANISRVLAVCSQEEPVCVIMEYLENGDLCQYLKSVPLRSLPSSDDGALVDLCVQIAAGMRYLEALHFVHRDVAARNCLVSSRRRGRHHVKICDFGVHNEHYSADYYLTTGGQKVPLRWMAWEALFRQRYSTKSDVWSFGCTMWEILSYCQKRPYAELSDTAVFENLAVLQRTNDKQQPAGEFQMLMPSSTAVDTASTSSQLYDLMVECWRRCDGERPTFREIHLFLQRLNLGNAPPSLT